MVLGLAMTLAGGALAAGGVVLIATGGSWYYLPTGLALIASAIGLGMGKRFALSLFGLLLAATLAWSLWEAGLNGWALVPRLVGPAVLGAILLLPMASSSANRASRWWVGLPVIAIAATLLIAGFTDRPTSLPGAKIARNQVSGDGEWHHWGRTLSGRRFSPLTQINTGNVPQLELAWEFEADIEPFAYHSFEATPLAADGKLFLCLDRNVIVALDQDSGQQVWRFDPKPNLEGVFAATCRGVSLFEAPEGTEECPTRILFGVADGRLMAIDAATGKRCTSFGSNGEVNLKAGLGEVPPGMVFPSSPPTIMNGLTMISGWVTDGLHTNSPSGGVRAYDALTGDLRWVWDPVRDPQAPLAEGETYTRGAPNAWGVFSGDPDLGLVYFGTGVTTPDYFGAHRSPELEEYATSIVALDVETGRPQWHFQTVHHDLWDYDIGSQPVLADIEKDGATVPALIGPTKRGQFFVLDRRTGQPVYPVVEKPVPQGAVEGDWTAKTQPYSEAFANVAGEKLTEEAMWGVTPLDQLWCRIQFRKARYEGDFTPPSTDRTIFYPGSAGGSNWGSVTIDPVRNLLIANSLYMADIGRLIPRKEADRIAAAYGDAGDSSAFAFPQKGTPFAMDRSVFLNPLGVPCQQPPYGRLNAIDLTSGELVWSKPLGTAQHAGPLGLGLGLPIRMGVPNLGGSIATAGGLIFIGAAQDRKLRAINIGNGKELWSHSLPSIGAATPMTYRSRKSGRQYVVIAAGGHPPFRGHGTARCWHLLYRTSSNATPAIRETPLVRYTVRPARRRERHSPDRLRLLRRGQSPGRGCRRRAIRARCCHKDRRFPGAFGA